MGYIKEPDGVDLVIGPSVLNEEDKRIFAEALAAYHATHPRITQTSLEEAYRVHVLGEPAPATAS